MEYLLGGFVLLILVLGVADLLFTGPVTRRKVKKHPR